MKSSLKKPSLGPSSDRSSANRSRAEAAARPAPASPADPRPSPPQLQGSCPVRPPYRWSLSPGTPPRRHQRLTSVRLERIGRHPHGQGDRLAIESSHLGSASSRQPTACRGCLCLGHRCAGGVCRAPWARHQFERTSAIEGARGRQRWLASHQQRFDPRQQAGGRANPAADRPGPAAAAGIAAAAPRARAVGNQLDARRGADLGHPTGARRVWTSRES